MAEVVYALCALFSVVCASLLFRGYQSQKARLLLWSSLAFAMLALNNIVLFVDLVIYPEMDFNGPLVRSAAGAIGGVLLLFGLIWEGT
ncbi:MAG: DUF5985 family protein [Pseudobdellovibrionaceae bacterium]